MACAVTFLIAIFAASKATLLSCTSNDGSGNNDMVNLLVYLYYVYKMYVCQEWKNSQTI